MGLVLTEIVVAEPVEIVVVHRDVHPVATRADIRPARERNPGTVAAGDGQRELVERVVRDQEACVRFEHVDVAGKQVDEPLIDYVVGPDRQVWPCADVDAVEGPAALALDRERLSPRRGGESFRKLLAAAGRVSIEGVVQRAGEILRGADRVEVVVSGVEDTGVLEHLQEPERQNDRPVAALLLNELRCNVRRIANATKGNPAGVKAPVLRARGRVHGSRQQTGCNDPSNRRPPCQNAPHHYNLLDRDFRFACPRWYLYTPESRRAHEILFGVQSSSSRGRHLSPR